MVLLVVFVLMDLQVLTAQLQLLQNNHLALVPNKSQIIILVTVSQLAQLEDMPLEPQLVEDVDLVVISAQVIMYALFAMEEHSSKEDIVYQNVELDIMILKEFKDNVSHAHNLLEEIVKLAS